MTLSSTASAASLEPFHTRPSDVRHPMEDTFKKMAWGANLGLEGTQLHAAAPMYTLLDRRRGVNATRVTRWGYRWRYLNGVTSGFSRYYSRRFFSRTSTVGGFSLFPMAPAPLCVNELFV